MKKRINILATAIVLILLAACGSKRSSGDNNTIRVGVESGPEYEVAQAALKVAREKFGLEVELVAFNDYVMPNEALHQGDIDLNVFQNRPYLDVQAKQRGYKFAVLGNTFVYPLAGYSKKIKKLSDLKDGSTIVIPNDPTNGGRSLLLLEKAGLIKLRSGVGLLPTVNDIINNSRTLRLWNWKLPSCQECLMTRM